MKFKAYLTQTVSATVTVELSDKELAEIAEENDVQVSELTDQMLEDAVYEKAHDEHPAGLCAHCSGWGQDWSRDEAGVWEADGFDRKED